MLAQAAGNPETAAPLPEVHVVLDHVEMWAAELQSTPVGVAQAQGVQPRLSSNPP